ncbi:hypothetical protein [Candidatus Magnetominusculus dajiuhuensis]|uniref:hypothetical protein n=1 Tax=Candidatus Magnetominusculus dajiuhuensis TaxID=3137712 RepID=UPI003B42EF2A
MKNRKVVVMVLAILCFCSVMAGTSVKHAEAVCLANHTEMTIYFYLVDPTNKLATISGKLGGEDVPECYPGAHPKYGGARNVYFFQKQAFMGSKPLNVYAVPNTVAKHNTVVFYITGSQAGAKDMTLLKVQVVGDNATVIYDGAPVGPSQIAIKK